MRVGINFVGEVPYYSRPYEEVIAQCQQTLELIPIGVIQKLITRPRKRGKEIQVCYSCYFFWALSMSIGETGGHC